MTKMMTTRHSDNEAVQQAWRNEERGKERVEDKERCREKEGGRRRATIDGDAAQ